MLDNNTVNTVARPKHTASMRSSMILIGIRLKVYTGTVTDQEVSDEVNTSKKASSKASRVVKYLLADCPEHRHIILLRQKIANWAKAETYPWDESLRALPIERYPKFMYRWDNELMPIWDAAVGAMAVKWKDIVSNAAFQQGDMFKREDFLTADQLKGRFRARLYKTEIPEGDFREIAVQGIADDLHAHYAKQATGIVNGIVENQMQQLVKVMQSISHCCGYNIKTLDNGTTKISRRKLHEDTIKRALEYCETFKQFNVSGNQELEDTRAALENVLLTYGDIDVLRSSEHARAHIKTEMDSILCKFSFPGANETSASEDEIEE